MIYSYKYNTQFLFFVLNKSVVILHEPKVAEKPICIYKTDCLYNLVPDCLHHNLKKNVIKTIIIYFHYSVISYSCTPMGAPNASTPSIASLTLTPARFRDLDQDMQALRLSRQDNPFIQKVIESRESLADTLEESVSDDAILMSQVSI